MNIIFFEKIDSTNTYAKSNIDDLADKTVISTDIQTKGRGRFDRSWTDLGRENIYMTIIFKTFKSIFRCLFKFNTIFINFLCRQLEEMGLSPR